MKRVSAYQATDGQVFTDRAACKKHQTTLDILSGVRDIAGRIQGDSRFEDDNGYYSVGGADLVTFLIENRDDLIAALTAKHRPEQAALNDAEQEAMNGIEPDAYGFVQLAAH